MKIYIDRKIEKKMSKQKFDEIIFFTWILARASQWPSRIEKLLKVPETVDRQLF